MTTTESPTVSPGSREADTATPVTGRHAHPYPDVMQAGQVIARFSMLEQLFALRRAQRPRVTYQPRHEAREWGVRHSLGVDGKPFIGGRFGEIDAYATRDCARDGCTSTVVSRVLPDGEWEVAS